MTLPQKKGKAKRFDKNKLLVEVFKYRIYAMDVM